MLDFWHLVKLLSNYFSLKSEAAAVVVVVVEEPWTAEVAAEEVVLWPIG